MAAESTPQLGVTSEGEDGDGESLIHLYVLAVVVVGVVVGYLRFKKQQRHSAPVGGMSSLVARTKYDKVPTDAPEDSGAGWDDGWDNDNDNDEGWEDHSGGR